MRRTPFVGFVMAAASSMLTGPVLAFPVAIGTNEITVSYPASKGGQISATDNVDYSGGSGPLDATQLGDAANIAAFNSNGNAIGTFGRRAAPILLTDPMLPPVFGPNEALVSHAFFKLNNGQVYFPGIAGVDSDITVQIHGIQFDQPVEVVEDTLMLHTRWAPLQADPLFYVHIDDHFTVTENFRDFDTFFSRIFFDGPVPNYVLNSEDVAVTIEGEGTDTLNLSMTFPYSLLRNLEDSGQTVPGGLPAPFGFLEPFHFHIEYVVVPEPGTLVLLIPGAVIALRRRR